MQYSKYDHDLNDNKHEYLETETMITYKHAYDKLATICEIM